MKSRLDPSQYSQFLKCYSFNIDICIKLLNSVIFVGDIKARIPFSFFIMNWILVFIWHRFNTVHWNSLRLFYAYKYIVWVTPVLMGIPSITNYMYLSLYGSQRISGHEWFRTPEALGSNPSWDLATRYSPCTFNIFITRVVFFVFLCFLYEPVISINIIFGII